MIDNSNEGYLLKVADNLKLIPIAGVFPIENTGAEFFEKRNGTVTMDTSRKTYIRLSDLLWRILTENCVPLNRGIAAQLGRSPRALDIYQWLAYRTYALKKPVIVPWENLRSQFDSVDTPMYSFRRRFCRSLEKVLDAWPELATSVGEKGLTVYPTGSSLTSGKGKEKAFGQGTVSSAKESAMTENPF